MLRAKNLKSFFGPEPEYYHKTFSATLRKSVCIRIKYSLLGVNVTFRRTRKHSVFYSKIKSESRFTSGELEYHDFDSRFLLISRQCVFDT